MSKPSITHITRTLSQSEYMTVVYELTGQVQSREAYEAYILLGAKLAMREL